jgi:hypothetical protein
MTAGIAGHDPDSGAAATSRPAAGSRPAVGGGVRADGRSSAPGRSATSHESAASHQSAASRRAAACGRVAVLGVRHHGPGSARSVLTELDRLQPGTVLIEGPADADPLIGLAADPGMTPPVALLAYATGAPRISAFWPFALFSPEWQALRWAAAHHAAVRFCDLPSSMLLAGADHAGMPARPGQDHEAQDHEGRDPEGPDHTGQDHAGQPGEPDASRAADPIAMLATAAGFDDPERWWDQLIEGRPDGPPPFAALTEAMAELRANAPDASPAEQRREALREAHMRQVLRSALKNSDGVVAVVCGAWHAPALAGPLPAAAPDAALLRGAVRRKTTLTWVPWTHSRLAATSGYGAGITSPGWYHHLFTAPDRTIIRWLTRVAGVLRAHDLPVSSAHVIEAVRLAETLAALRGRPLAGLAEVSEAAKSVMCDGDDLAAEFISRDLVLGELLGAVPEDAPTVPLEADLRAQAKTLRLRIDPLERAVALDLRKELDRRRSVLLHRLSALGVGWGTPSHDTVRATGTFRETWALRWRPELTVEIADAALWGTTVAAAAAGKITSAASTAADLATVTAAVEITLLADLPGALPAVLRSLNEKAALDLDVGHLMAALPALVRAVRYGDVRGTGTGALSAVADALIIRICAGLPAVVSSLADDAAARLRDQLNEMHTAVALHAQHEAGQAARDQWLGVLSRLAGRRDVHGLLAGRMVRLLLDAQVLAQDEAARRFSAHLSAGVPAADKAAWAEGFLSGSGLLLASDQELLTVLDAWVTALGEQEFLDVLPLLRRTFGGFTAPERANIGRAVTRLAGPPDGAAGAAEPVDADRAQAVLRTVAAILGGAR